MSGYTVTSRYAEVRGRKVRNAIILGCSGTKDQRNGWLPAWKRYQGPLWQTLRSTGWDGAEQLPFEVWVLSAKHGFIGSWDEIEDYDTRITDRLTPGRPLTRQDDMKYRPDRWHSALFVELCKRADRVYAVMGEAYEAVLLDWSRFYDVVPPTFSRARGIGEHRAQLKTWVGVLSRSAPTDAPLQGVLL